MALYELFDFVENIVTFSWCHCKAHAKIIDVSMNIFPVHLLVGLHRNSDDLGVYHTVPGRCQKEDNLHDTRQVHNVGHELSYDILAIKKIHRHLGTCDEWKHGNYLRGLVQVMGQLSQDRDPSNGNDDG